MGRPRKWPPAMLKHKSGQARVYWRGKNYYLGPYGSPEANSAYTRLLVELEQAEADGWPDRPAKGALISWTVLQYAKWLEQQPESSERRKMRNISTSIVALFGPTKTEDFRVRQLESLRTSWIRGIGCEKKSPQTANRDVKRVLTIFQWLEVREYVKPGTYAHLLSLPRLKAPPPAPREPVEWEIVQKTLPHVKPTVAAMIMVGWWTGMRPGEIVSIRADKIDRTSQPWRYTLEFHKTRGKTGKHVIPLGPQCQAAIGMWVDRAKDGWLFPGVNEGRHYVVESFCRAIQRACDKHQIPHWHPYQLRHAAKRRIATAYGIEAARVILRHTTLGTTGLYDRTGDEKEAARIAGEAG